MASVHRVKTSRFWFGSFYKPDGGRVFRSTKQTDEAAALRLTMEWERIARGELPASAEQARRVIADIVRLAVGTDEIRMTCAEYVQRWLAAQTGTVAASTLAFYRGALDAWVKWLGPRALRQLDGIQRSDIESWRKAESERVRAKTANHRLKAVRALFKGAIAEHFATVNPADGVKGLRLSRKEKKVRRPFTREELAKVLAVCDETWTLLTLAGLETGQRLGDIARMEWGELDLAKEVWSVTTGKTGHALRIPLSADLVARLTAREGGENKGAVFPDLVAQIGRSNGYIGGVSKQFAHLLWQAGLRSHTPYGQGEKKVDDRRVQHELSFHSLRHTARTWLEEAGQPKAVIDALIGHDGDTGKIYTTVGEDALRKAAAALAAARK